MNDRELVPDVTKINHYTYICDIEAPGLKSQASMILARCDCGKERKLRHSEFVRGLRKSCGCHRQNPLAEGQEKGEWTLLKKTKIEYKSRAQEAWECRCSCGNVRTVDKYALTSGASTNCGCIRTQMLNEFNTTHGMSNHPYYNLWHNMMARCYTKSHPKYPDYGARGIKVYRLWHDIVVFIKYLLSELGDRPDPDSSIDRIDNDGDYTIGNIKWSNRIEQMSNTRKSNLFDFKGEWLTIAEIARRTGIPDHLIRDRVFRLNKSIEEALAEI